MREFIYGICVFVCLLQAGVGYFKNGQPKDCQVYDFRRSAIAAALWLVLSSVLYWL